MDALWQSLEIFQHTIVTHEISIAKANKALSEKERESEALHANLKEAKHALA